MAKKFYVFVMGIFLLATTPVVGSRFLKSCTEDFAQYGATQAMRSFPVLGRFVSTLSKGQVYTVPTYDAAFKWVLSHDDVRPSFFHAFIPGLNITSSTRLDEHMNPLEKLQNLREFLHKDETSTIVNNLSGSNAFVANTSGKSCTRDDAATAFLKEMVGRFDEIKASFPRARFDGTMDFVCQLDTSDYALVEMQVIPQNYWDRRALAYAAAFYGNQLSRGQSWKHIRKVIGINILGGGRDNKAHLSDFPNHFMRHYKFEDQLNGKGRFIDGIELIQYSIRHSPITPTTQEQQDWLTFFKEAQYMSEADVNVKIETAAVKKAFELAKLSKLPTSVQQAYEAEDEEYSRYSQHTADLVAEGKKEVAKNLIKSGKLSDQEIVDASGLSLAKIIELRNENIC